jgi:hypothetical protein
MAYAQPEADVLTLEGTWNGRMLKARLRFFKEADHLTTRGFRWINEHHRSPTRDQHDGRLLFATWVAARRSRRHGLRAAS